MSGTKHYVSLFPACPLAPHLALKNPRLRALDLSKQIEDLGGRGGQGHEVLCPRHVFRAPSKI